MYIDVYAVIKPMTLWQLMHLGTYIYTTYMCDVYMMYI